MAVLVTGQPVGSQQQLEGDAPATCSPLWVLCTRNICMRQSLRNGEYCDLVTHRWCYWHFGKGGSSLWGAAPYVTGCPHPRSAPPLLCGTTHWQVPRRVVERPPAPQVENRCLVYSPCKGSPVTDLKCKAAEKLRKRKWVRFSEAKKSSCELGHQRILRCKGAGLWLWPWWWDLID